MTDKQVRVQFTQEFKLEAVRQVRGGQALSVVANMPGIPNANVGRWVRRPPKVSSTPVLT
jgi:transposase-like protein